MPFLSDNAHDALLNAIQDNVETLYICSTAPTTYTEASSTYALGNKSSPTVGEPTNGDTSGRKIVVSAISDGSVTADGTAAYWALCKDSATSELLVAGDLASSQGVSNGNTFTLTAFDIENPDPT